MKAPKRISLSLFDEELKTLINASAKIFPMSQEDIDNDLNPNNYEYAKVGRSIYAWHNGKWEYIIADDIEIDWTDIDNKPAKYPPTDHTHENDHIHDNKSILDAIVQALIDKWNTVTNKADTTYVNEGLSNKSDTIHNHDNDYSKLGHIHDYSPAEHNHDNRYFTKGEVEASLSLKAPLAHVHDGRYYQKQEVDNKLSQLDFEDKYAPKAHIDDIDMHVTPDEKQNWNDKSPFRYEQEFLELRDHYGYMNINGGDFDGNNGYYLMIDGGEF